MEAALAKNLLESHGISSRIAGSVPQQPGLQGLPVGFVLQVGEDKLERAKNVLAPVVARRGRRSTYGNAASEWNRVHMIYGLVLIGACIIMIVVGLVALR
jgi:hypothetical protein